MSVIFNHPKFYQDLNSARARRRISWNKVAARAGVAPTGMSLYVKYWENPKAEGAKEKVLDLENTVKLLHWLRVSDISKYVIDEDDLEDVE